MSVKMMGIVWDNQDLPPNLKLTLLAYADKADHEGNNIFPGVKLIAQMTGYSERQIRRNTQDLRDQGYLIYHGQHPHYDTNIYSMGVTICQGGGDIPPDNMSGKMINHHYIKDDEEALTFQALFGETIISGPIAETEAFKECVNLYNQVQIITPLIADHISDALEDYGYMWVKTALERTIENHGTSWNYVKRILENMKKYGFEWKPQTNGDKKQTERMNHGTTKQSSSTDAETIAKIEHAISQRIS